MFALVDCNQFYVSCERIFRPHLHNRPVVVLSNNDGCVVTLSSQAKQIGIKRGDPFFQITSTLHKHKGIACSSNYTLYGDISQRVMDTLLAFSPDVEPYSIDEAFIPLSKMTPFIPDSFISYVKYAKRIQSRLWRDIRMGVGVGIGPTRTLAKLANRIAKRNNGVHVLYRTEDAIPYLENLELSNIWGIGHRSAQKISKAHSVRNALDFVRLPEYRVQQLLGICGVRTHRELRGVSCIDLDAIKPPKSIRHGRSFSTRISDFNTLKGIVAQFCGVIGTKLRKHRLFAHTLQLRLTPPRNHYRRSRSAHISFCDTQDTRTLIRHVLILLKRLHSSPSKEAWKKAEVLVVDLRNQQHLPLFSEPEDPTIMNLVDSLQQRFGKHVLRTGAESPHSPVSSKYRSPRYSTQWSDILTIRI